MAWFGLPANSSALHSGTAQGWCNSQPRPARCIGAHDVGDIVAESLGGWLVPVGGGGDGSCNGCSTLTSDLRGPTRCRGSDQVLDGAGGDAVDPGLHHPVSYTHLRAH